ncbi:TPA: hypothetical protein N0F65_006484, partial [Lagenidium giganteum]
IRSEKFEPCLNRRTIQQLQLTGSVSSSTESSTNHRRGAAAMADGDLWRDRNKVFVAGIPAYVDDAALADKFKQFGEMFQSKVVYDNRTNKSKGFGFVTFSEYVNALDAVNTLNQTKWDGRTLNVRFLQPKAQKGGDGAAVKKPAKVFGPLPEGCATIYVGNLAYDITEEVLRKVFDKCGAIKAVRFAEHIQTKEFRGFGYVQFYEGEAVLQAIKLDGMVVMGRPMNIDYGSRDEETAKAREEMGKKLKKGICHKFQSGQCDRGNDCKFAHVLKDQDVEEMISQADRPVGSATVTQANADATVCINFQKGKCKRGSDCRFLHLGAGDESANQDNGDYNAYEADEQPVAEVAVPEPIEEPTEAAPDAPACQNFQKGKCKRGSRCRFRHIHATEEPEEEAPAHEQAPARVKLDVAAVPEVAVCQNYRRGRCNRGASCRFAHTDHVKAAAVPVEQVSYYQKRFQSICYNWQNSASCVRGDDCPFQHDQSIAPAKSAAVETAKEVTGVDDEEDSKKAKKDTKKHKKRKSSDADEEEANDDEDDSARKEKKKEKKAKTKKSKHSD